MRLASFAGLLRAAAPSGTAAPVESGWTTRLLAGVRSLLTARGALSLIALAVLVNWGQTWNKAFKKWKVKPPTTAWYVPYDFMSLDFMHNYQAARFLLSGHNPYREDFQDPIGRKLCYPPIVLVFFLWCKIFPIQKAFTVWTIALGLLAGWGAFLAWRTRQRLGLAPVPLLVAVAAIVTSAPVAFAMERGNYDLLLVPQIAMIAWGLRRTGWRADAVIGYGLGIAICLKVYPGLLLFALVARGRWRAIGLTAAVGAAALAYHYHDLPIFVENLRQLANVHRAVEYTQSAVPAAHSITLSWVALWSDTKLGALARIPGGVAAVGIVGSLVLWVGYHLWRCPDPRNVILPVLLWAAGAATFVPRISNDYNLFFLPMAALAVWDRRDPVALHVALGFMCVWVQPVGFPLSFGLQFALKIVALIAVAACVVNRTREQSAPAGPPLPPQPRAERPDVQ